MSQLLDTVIDTKLKLCALWISILICFIYSDYFRLFVPGMFEAMRTLSADPEIRDFDRAAHVIGASPILMIFLSVALPAKYNRTLNILVGVFFVLFFTGSSLFAVFRFSLPLSAVKIMELAVAVFAALVVWYASKWPMTQNAV